MAFLNSLRTYLRRRAERIFLHRQQKKDLEDGFGINSKQKMYWHTCTTAFEHTHALSVRAQHSNCNLYL